MPQLTDAQLKALANQIGNETTPLANTPARVGTMLINLIDSKPNVDGLTNTWRLRGNYNGSTNLFPATGGTGAGSAIEAFNVWVITAYGVVGSTDLSVGAFLIALVDSPGQDETKWRVL